MEGQLSEHPLAELISEILEKRFSGALRIARDRAKGVVYFIDGELIYATSNLQSLRLTEYLKKRGLGSLATNFKNARSDFELAAGLISNGGLPRPVLDEILAEQAADVLRVTLLWTSGEWSFDARARLTEQNPVRIQIRQLLVNAARQADLRYVSSRFRGSVEVISPVSDAPSDLDLSPTEGFILSRVEGPIAIGELIMLSGLREPDTLRTIYGLVLAGCLNREVPPYAFRAVPAAKPRKKPLPGTPAPTQMSKEQPPEPVRDPQQEIQGFLELLANATNHYQVLNVELSANGSEIKSAYYSLARRFHPDRFHELAGTPIHASLEAAFARITQAHETLSNPALKSPYDSKIATWQRTGNTHAQVKPPDNRSQEASSSVGDLQSAEKNFQDGVAALQAGQMNVALSCLSAAARMSPTKPMYRAFYGRALGSNERTQRLAEAELQVAVKLDPDNVSYRLMLAGLYRKLGFSHRAVAELERVLALEPQNTEARKMLQLLGAKK